MSTTPLTRPSIGADTHSASTLTITADSAESYGAQRVHYLIGNVHYREPRMSLERQVRIAAGAIAATGGILALIANPAFAAIPAAVGSGLVFAGVTDTCMMGMLLAKLPYNRPARCDVPAMVRALAAGDAPARGRAAAADTAA